MTVETSTVIGGQKIGLLFGLPAIEYLQKKIPGFAGNMEMRFQIKQFAHIIYAAYLNYCDAENMEEEIKFRTVYDWVNDSALAQDLTEVTRIIKLFFKSKEVEVSENKEDAGEEKKSKPLDWLEIETFCLRKKVSFQRTSWRDYVLLRRGHNQERTEVFESTRFIAYCALKPYLKEGTTLEEFWSLESDPKDEVVDETEWLKQMNEQAQKMAEIYSKQNNLS